MALNLHQILAVNDIKTKIIDIPSWGNGGVKIKAMSIKDQLDYEKLTNTTSDFVELGLFLVKISCIDDDGKLLFSDNDMEILKTTKSSESIVKLINEILELNNQKPDSIEELEKN